MQWFVLTALVMVFVLRGHQEGSRGREPPKGLAQAP